MTLCDTEEKCVFQDQQTKCESLFLYVVCRFPEQEEWGAGVQGEWQV